MSAYEYIAVATSIVVGLAITQLLSGVAQLYHARKDVRTYWLHTAWNAVLLLFAFRIWWVFWLYRDVPEWGFFQFLLYLSPSIVFYFLAAIAVPDMQRDTVNDLRGYYYSNRTGFFGGMAVHGLLSLLAPSAILGAPVFSATNGIRGFGVVIVEPD